MDLQKDIDKTNKKIKELSDKQKELNDKIEIITNEKEGIINSIMIEKRKNNILERFEKVSKDINEVLSNTNLLKQLDEKLFSLYEKSFRRIVPKRIETNIKLPEGLNHYHRGNNNIYLNIKGIGSVDTGYWNDYKMTKYIKYVDDIVKIVKDCPNLISYINNPIKRDVYKIFKNGTKDWHVVKKDYIILDLKLDVKALYYGSDSDVFGIKDIYLKDNNYVEIRKIDNHIVIRFKNSSYTSYWAEYTIRLDGEWDSKQRLSLLMLPDNIIKSVEEYVDVMVKTYDKNLELYKKLEEKLMPYIAMDLI